ncbi:MAG: hypothetical protein WAU82_08360 [Candidatus Binatus sp.]|uniref:hypothetical protein n=1 Tax=Candidatus Binatus sp. TaxID=2811406 RepID=UPI003BB03F19
MEKLKKQRLERAGWTAGSARDFLELSDEETARVEVELELVDVAGRRAAARDPSLRSG